MVKIFFIVTAVRVVKVRAEAMQKDSEAVPSGMMMAFLNPNAKLKLACQSARRFCQTRRDIENPVCGVANYLFPEGKVLAGHSEVFQFKILSSLTLHCHLHPLQAVNCCRYSRLVMDKDDLK